MFSIKIPVSGFIKKYLISQYGSSFMLARTDHVGIMLFMLLKKNQEDKRYDYSTEKYNERYEVKLSGDMMFERGVRYLSNYSIVQFNIFLGHIIKDELHKYIDNAMDNGVMQKDAIKDFMSKYKFTDSDIDPETLKKGYHRYQSRVNSLKKMSA